VLGHSKAPVDPTVTTASNTRRIFLQTSFFTLLHGWMHPQLHALPRSPLPLKMMACNLGYVYLGCVLLAPENLHPA
jgi:hypothetical protein